MKNKKIIFIITFITFLLFYLFYRVGLTVYLLLWLLGLILAIYLGKIIVNKKKRRNSTIFILMSEILILTGLLNPVSLYFLYGSFRISEGILTDLTTMKKEDYLNKCEIKKMSCSISGCEYENTKNCMCYNCLNDFNFENCSQCYMPATQESFCIENKCSIPNFP